MARRQYAASGRGDVAVEACASEISGEAVSAISESGSVDETPSSIGEPERNGRFGRVAVTGGCLVVASGGWSAT